MEFVPKLKSELLAALKDFNPNQYTATRNYIDGNVSRLSPYISRGVITTSEIGNYLFNLNWSKKELLKFLQELAWRDYFQIAFSFKHQNSSTKTNYKLPEFLLKNNSGIEGIDLGIETLMQHGYLHNHQRMYLAMLVCNILKIDFNDASRWMYFYLLDADEASNSLSWQWVAGKLTGKKYVANQENINHFCRTNQANTFLDVPYERLDSIGIPDNLKINSDIELKTQLPSVVNSIHDNTGHFSIHNFYNLDNEWCNNFPNTKILLIEPKHFQQYPICKNSIDFMIAQAKLMNGIQIFVGEFSELRNTFPHHHFHFKAHSLFSHYQGEAVPSDYLFNEVKDYYPSFSAYWKKCLKYL